MTPSSSGAIAAVDLGATSGRVILGGVRDGELRMKHVHRFVNEPVRTRDGLHWNVYELYRNVVAGLGQVERDAPGEVLSIGVDAWACDYGLFAGDRLLGVPFAYRDERTTRGVEAVRAKVEARELFARNGLQHLAFNTLFQLAAEGEMLEVADRMLLIPDLVSFWLTGVGIAERTNASTTGLLDARTREWDTQLAVALGIPPRLFAPLVDAGEAIGALAPEVVQLVGRSIPVVTVGSHDTASAVVAIPNPGRDFAYISCGTWGLVGLELDAPVLSEAARRAGFTNEGGVDGRVRFLHNVMGLWLLSESIRAWDRVASEAQRSSMLQELLEDAAKVVGRVAIFDASDEVFLAPGDMPARIAEWCRAHDEPVPATRAEFVRSIVESLAQAFADSVREASDIAGHPVSVIHMVGGGAQNELLCQATANRSGLPVLAGPVEATAIGNILVQARAAGLVSGDLERLRAVVARSVTSKRYEPMKQKVV